MFENRTLPIYQLEAVMNLDNVYGMDEIIGDPIHAIEGTPEPTKRSFNWWWLLSLLIFPIIIFLYLKGSHRI